MSRPPEPLFLAQAIDSAVQVYVSLRQQAEPVPPAAFGVACEDLRERLNINLASAAVLLRTELDRRKL